MQLDYICKQLLNSISSAELSATHVKLLVIRSVIDTLILSNYLLLILTLEQPVILRITHKTYCDSRNMNSGESLGTSV